MRLGREEKRAECDEAMATPHIVFSVSLRICCDKRNDRWKSERRRPAQKNRILRPLCIVLPFSFPTNL
jgi:hypothetical protein